MRATRRHPRRVTLAQLACAALVLAALAAGALAARGAATPELRIAAAGSISLGNSRDGLAIFSAPDLVPGASASGTVSISNTGAAAGALALTATDPRNAAGPYGGILSRRALLAITDTTAGSDAPIFTGTLEAFSATELLTLMPGEERTYRFDVELPEGGVPSSDLGGDNVYQGSGAEVDYTWSLTELGESPPRCGNELHGDDGPNRLAGTESGDRIHAYGGRDTVRARGGDDCVESGGGGDRVRAGAGDDRVEAGEGADAVAMGAGNDVVFSRGGGVDEIDCGAGDDRAAVGPRDRVRRC